MADEDKKDLNAMLRKDTGMPKYRSLLIKQQAKSMAEKKCILPRLLLTSKL